MITPVRRQAVNPSGGTPACRATSSPHAPAALTTTGAWMVAPGPGPHVPHPSPPLDPFGAAAKGQDASLSTNLSQEALVEGRDVDIERVLLDGGGIGKAWPQRGNHRPNLIRRDGPEPLSSGQQALQFRLLLGRTEEHHRPPAHQRRISESRGWTLEKGARKASQHANVRRAVVQDPHRRRPAGRVIAGRVLRLDHGHAMRVRQGRNGGRARDSGADHDYVESIRTHPVNIGRPDRARKQARPVTSASLVAAVGEEP